MSKAKRREQQRRRAAFVNSFVNPLAFRYPDKGPLQIAAEATLERIRENLRVDFGGRAG